MRITCQVPRLGRQRGKLERHNVKFDLLALMRWSYHSGVYILWPVSHFSVQTGFSVYPDHFHVILKICLGNLYCNSISFLFVSQTGLWIVSLTWFPERSVSSAALSTLTWPIACNKSDKNGKRKLSKEVCAFILGNTCIYPSHLVVYLYLYSCTFRQQDKQAVTQFG